MSIPEIILLIESIPVYGWAVVLILAVAVCLLALNTKMNIMINIENRIPRFLPESSNRRR